MPDVRIEGPYKHRDKWRCRLCAAGHRRWAGTADTPEHARLNAEAEVEEYRAKVELTIGGVIERYLESMVIEDKSQATRDAARIALNALLGDIKGQEVASLTEARAKRLYMELVPRRSAATHRRALRHARTCWAWAVREKLARGNPWGQIRPVGKEAKGKEQLSVDEERRLAECALVDAATDDGALAVLLLIFCGLRASEVTKRNVRDVDRGGKALLVPCSKTPTGRRAIDLPDCIQPAVAARLGRTALDPLVLNSEGGRPMKQWVWRAVKRYCLLAGVPVVCPHALRGGWATIAYGSGALSHAVAAALGHASPSTTEDHYVQPGVPQAAAMARKLVALQGGKR